VERILITDAQGQVVINEHPRPTNGTVRIDLSGVAPGVFSARLLHHNGSWSSVRLLFVR
jgi:hypothetical protein